jgi:hypothetical protein
MARILVANIDNENMLADERAFTPDFRLSSSITAGRMAWFAEPGDIVVLPRDLSPQFKDYIDRVRGHAPGSIAYVTPDWNDDAFRPLGTHELLHRGLPAALKRLMRGHKSWSLFPYCYERGAELLGEALGLDMERQVRPFLRQGGAELLNDKRVFRSLAAGRGVPLARGVVCNTTNGLVDSVRALIGASGAVIIKQDRHSGGLGNLIISRSKDISGLGATDVILAAEDADIPAACAEVWRRLAYLERVPLVVEVYYAVATTVTAEYRIDAGNNTVTFLSCGEVRQAPILSGLIMPWTLPPTLGGIFTAGATELARMCCDLGYDGLINIDGIVTIDGRVIYNEFNGRVGGCSHIHHILQSVAGAFYGDTLAVASHSRDINIGIDRVLGILRQAKLGFDAESGRGIILTAEDAAGSGFLEYLSIARTHAEALQLETVFERMLEAGFYEERPSGIEHLENILTHLTPAAPTLAEQEPVSTTGEPEPATLHSNARKS